MALPAEAASPCRRALLVANPGARSGNELDVQHVLTRLGTHGVEATHLPLGHGDSITRAISSHATGVDLVVVAGGDGTLSMAAPALLESGKTLGILPAGTANDLAHTLGIPEDLDQACDVLCEGRARAIDVGMANGIPFFNAATLGLSIEVTHELSSERKKRWGVLGYGIALVRAWRHARSFRARVTCDGALTKLKTRQLTIGNGERHGGGVQVAPDARIDDAMLDLYSLSPRNIFELAAVGIALRRGGHDDGWKAVHSLHGRDITVSTRKRMPVSTDGEVTTQTPVRFAVLPGAVHVMVPR